MTKERLFKKHFDKAYNECRKPSTKAIISKLVTLENAITILNAELNAAKRRELELRKGD